MPINPRLYHDMFKDSWRCPVCNTLNLSDEKVCQKCGRDKPPKEFEIRAWRDHDGKVY